MKPKDIQIPFSFAERRPLLQEGLLCVPRYYNDHTSFGQLNWHELFGNDNPVCIEFCSGNGEWICQKAKEEPNKNWVAVEMQFTRARKICSKRYNEGLQNLFVICGDARDVARYYITTASIERAFVNFPDPWPKNRHAKHRLIQAPFPRELTRIISYKGTILLVTDDATYFAQMEREMTPFWSCSASVNESYGESFFKRLWTSHGKTIHFLTCTNDIYRLDARVTSDLDWHPPEGVSFWSIQCGLEEADFPFSDELTCNALAKALAHFIEHHWNRSPICLYEGPLREEAGLARISHTHGKDGRSPFGQIFDDDLSRECEKYGLGEYLQYLASKLPEEAEVYAFFEPSPSPARRAYYLSPDRFGHINTSRISSAAEVGIVLPLDEYCSEALFDQIDAIAEDRIVIPEKYLTEMWDGLSRLIAFEGCVSTQGKRKLQGFEAALGQVEYTACQSSLL